MKEDVMESSSSLALADIVRVTSVSVSTIARVLNQREGSIPISQTTGKRVREEARRLGYAPNSFANSTHGRIGAVLRDTARSGINRH
jgi:DNA-binding LacI/PurR family transcriptional regulator